MSKVYTAHEMRVLADRIWDYETMSKGLELCDNELEQVDCEATHDLIHMLRQAADALERECGDMAAMREALQSILCLAYEVNDANADGGTRTSMPTQFVIDTIKSAIASPAHNRENCIVHTAADAMEREGRREKKYEYSVHPADVYGVFQHRSAAELNVKTLKTIGIRAHLIRREVGEWEEVKE